MTDEDKFYCIAAIGKFSSLNRFQDAPVKSTRNLPEYIGKDNDMSKDVFLSYRVTIAIVPMQIP
jgi:hypothetical protein